MGEVILLVTSPMENVRLSNRTGGDRFLTELEYRTAVAEFDRLWGSNTSPEDQVNMERLIRLIDAFESTHAVQLADAACLAAAGAKLHADVGGRTSHYSLYRSRQAIPISQTNSVNQKEMKR
jgi:hypothetical protein